MKRPSTTARRKPPSKTKRAAPAPAAPPTGYQDPTTFPDVYAVIVRGHCLEPAVPDMSRVLCDKRLKYERGDLVVVYLRPEKVKAGGMASVLKRLYIGPPTGMKFPMKVHPESDCVPVVILEMDNPRRWLTVPCDAIQAIHRAVGPVDRKFESSSGMLSFPASYLEELGIARP